MQTRLHHVFGTDEPSIYRQTEKNARRKPHRPKKAKQFSCKQQQRFYKRCFNSPKRDLEESEQRGATENEQARQNKQSQLIAKLRASYGFSMDPEFSIKDCW